MSKYSRDFGQGKPSQQQVQVNIDEFDNVECEKCKNVIFQPIFMMKKVPAMHPVNNTGREGVIPLQVAFACSNCGHIPKEFLPENAQVEEETPQEQPQSQIITTDLKLER